MSEPNAKLGRILEILIARRGGARSNGDIAREVGCDEGMVRRARQVAQAREFVERIKELEAENAEFRAGMPPKPVRRRKRHPDGPLPLFRETGDGDTYATDLPFFDVP